MVTAAGLAGDARHADGAPSVARFADPVGIAVAADGRSYIADSANHCLRLRSPHGFLSTPAGKPGVAGATDAPGSDARMDSPSAVAIDTDGSVVFSDTGNHTVRRLRSDGRVETIAGVAGDAGITNGPAFSARFDSPLGIVVAADRSLYVADSGNHSIRRIAPDGTVTTLAGENGEWGARDGTAALARFNGPVGLAIAPDRSLVVADSLNHAIRRVSTNGLVSTLAGKLGEDGSADGPADEARFGKPAELAFDAKGRLYIIDAFLHTVRRLDPDGRVRTVAGLTGHPGDANGDNGAGRFLNPYGIGVLPGGSLLVSDTYNATLREVLAPFVMSLQRRADGTSLLEWESVAGRRYRIYTTPSLDQPWQAVGAEFTADGPTSYFDDARTDARLYQVIRIEE